MELKDTTLALALGCGDPENPFNGIERGAVARPIYTRASKESIQWN